MYALTFAGPHQIVAGRRRGQLHLEAASTFPSPSHRGMAGPATDAASGAAGTLWDAATAGSLSKLNYGQLVTGVMHGVASDPSIMSKLSPQVRTCVSVLDTVITTAISGNDIGAAIASAAVELARTVLLEIVKDTALEISKDAASIVPVLGGLVSLVLDLSVSLGGSATKGMGPASSDIKERAAWCKSMYAVPIGSGPGFRVMPCDIFSPDAKSEDPRWDIKDMSGDLSYRQFFFSSPMEFDINGKPHYFSGMDESLPGMSSLGLALIYITETTLPLAGLRILDSVSKHVGDNSYSWTRDSRIGIDPKTQIIFRSLRLALQKTWKKGDGGASIWPLYMDLLRAEFDSGRINSGMVNYLIGINEIWTPLQGSAAPDGESCFSFDDRPAKAVFDLVQGWRQTVSPFYAQFKPSTEKQAIDAARKATQKRILTSIDASNGKSASDVLKTAAGLKKVNNHPIVGAAAGAGITAALVALFLRSRSAT